jgi:hypothetical protein
LRRRPRSSPVGGGFENAVIFSTLIALT